MMRLPANETLPRVEGHDCDGYGGGEEVAVRRSLSRGGLYIRIVVVVVLVKGGVDRIRVVVNLDGRKNGRPVDGVKSLVH